MHDSEGMMVSITTVVRKTPTKTLRTYFAVRDIPLGDFSWDVETNGKNKSIAQRLLKAVEALDPDTNARVVNEAERIGAMADEAGQTAIYGVVSSSEAIDKLENGYDRAMWLFLHDLATFSRAEEVRYTDDRRRGRDWDGFVVDTETVPKRDDTAIEAFMESIRGRFGSKNVHVDVFDRRRSTLDRDYSLIQATVYSEGRLEEYLEFVEGSLDTRGRHPVIEACLTYEPDEGAIEVVAKDRATREEYVRLFVRNLLGIEFEEERITLRRYDLAPLLTPHEFPTDPIDGIDNVRVNRLRLMPIDTISERVTLECLRGIKRTIWDVAAARFGDFDPLVGGWIVTQANLSIQFHPEQGTSRGKVLPLTITMPHGCDLKDRTERERLVGQKYLQAWGLVEEL